MTEAGAVGNQPCRFEPSDSTYSWLVPCSTAVMPLDHVSSAPGS